MELESLGRILSRVCPVGIYRTDAAGRLVYLNERWSEITGRSGHEILGRSWAEIIHPEDRDRVGRQLAGHPSEAEPAVVEYRLLSPTGRVVRVSDRSVAELDEAGRATGRLGAITNLDDQRWVPAGPSGAQPEISEEDAIRAQRLQALGVLAGGIAHDFNNIFMSLLGNVSLLRLREEIDPETAEILSDLERGCYRARDLSRQLLSFAKGNAPGAKPVEVGHLVHQAADLALHGSNLRCDFIISPGLPCLEVDEARVMQALNNIVINAAQAMPEGGRIFVRAETVQLEPEMTARYQLSPGQYVVISVEDRGPGIPPELLDLIFEPGFSTRDQALGLGLSTARTIIEGHGGRVGVASRPGEGAIFEVLLPTAEQVEAPRPGRAVSFQGSGRVLVMDDENAVRKIIGRMLEKLGYEVDFAANGLEAVRLFQRAAIAELPYRAVILDLTVAGGMGGVETFNLIRELAPEVKAIVSSGYPDDPILAHYREVGFSGRLVKPYRIDEVAEAMSELFPSGPA